MLFPTCFKIFKNSSLILCEFHISSNLTQLSVSPYLASALWNWTPFLPPMKTKQEQKIQTKTTKNSHWESCCVSHTIYILCPNSFTCKCLLQWVMGLPWGLWPLWHLQYCSLTSSLLRYSVVVLCDKWRSCSFSSADLASSCMLTVSRWTRRWGGPTQSSGLGLCGSRFARPSCTLMPLPSGPALLLCPGREKQGFSCSALLPSGPAPPRPRPECITWLFILVFSYKLVSVTLLV